MELAAKILLVLCGIFASAFCQIIQGSPSTEGLTNSALETESSIDDADVLTLFDYIDADDVEERAADDDSAVPQARSSRGRFAGPAVGGGRRRGVGRRVGGGWRGRGRGGARARNRRGHPACPLLEDDVEDMDAFVTDCLKEHRRVKVMIKKSRKNRRKPCNHECCQVAEGKKCCPRVKDGNCTLVIKDAVSLDLKVVRRRGGRWRGRGQGQAGQGGEDADQAACPTQSPSLRQLVNCGAQKARLLFVKGVPTALNSKLLCRADVDCGGEEICCSSAEDKCDRSCVKKSTPSS